MYRIKVQISSEGMERFFKQVCKEGICITVYDVNDFICSTRHSDLTANESTT